MKARLIKREGIAQRSSRSAIWRNSHGQLEAQGATLTGVAAIRAEVEARMTTSKHQKREQAREHFNNLFTRRT